METFNDLKQALLMKIDAFHYIQLGTVYRYHVCFVASHISLVLDNGARPSCCSVARYKSKHPCLRISYFCVSSTEVFIPSLTRKSSPCTKAAMYLWRTWATSMGRWWSSLYCIYDKVGSTEYNDANDCSAELPRPHHETVHGHILPARDDSPVLCQRLLHEAQHRLWAGASLQRREGEQFWYYFVSLRSVAAYGICTPLLLYLTGANVCVKALKSGHISVNVNAHTLAVQSSLNFSRQSNFSRGEPASSHLRLFFGGSATSEGERRETTPAFSLWAQLSCCSRPFMWQCGVFDGAPSLKALTRALGFYEWLFILFKETQLNLFFFFPAKAGFLFIDNSCSCMNQISFENHKRLLKLPINVYFLKGESIYPFTDSKAHVTLLKNVLENLSVCHQSH